MLWISCFFGVGTEYSVHWHKQGQIAAPSLLPGATEWFEEEGTRQQGYLMQEDQWCLKGGIMDRLQSPLSLCSITALPGHCFYWRLLEVMHDVLASLCYSLDLFLPSSGKASVLDSPWLVLFAGCSRLSEDDC